ncbi:hypothetical protein AAEU42_10085 [Pseudoflavonifractor phocaeensis]|uniref:hypothetical protein n=1 Tax=Pseudoflavonifractor phocaeensis TaxID=1870988 RepID=UPI00313B460F
MTFHGMSGTRLYRIYSGMKQRCYNPHAPQYSRYGGRGITVCPAWLGPEGFQHFYKWAMEHGYKDPLTIDRINSNQGYAPENCQWLTLSDNSSKAQREKSLRRWDGHGPHALPDMSKCSLFVQGLLKKGWRPAFASADQVLLKKGHQKITVPIKDEPKEKIKQLLSPIIK